MSDGPRNGPPDKIGKHRDIALQDHDIVYASFNFKIAIVREPHVRPGMQDVIHSIAHHRLQDLRGQSPRE